MDTLRDKLLSIELLRLLIESSDILHSSQLEEKQANWEDIWLVDIVLCEPRIAVNHVGFPQDRRQILGGASDGCCSRWAAIIALALENIFRLTKINQFNFAAGHEEQVGWLQVTVAEANGLKMWQCWNNADEHFLDLLGFPEQIHLLAFAVNVLEVEAMLNILANNANSECVVHSFVEEVAVELNDVRVVLSFEQLDGFLLHEMIQQHSPCTRSVCPGFSLRPLLVHSAYRTADEELCKFWCFSCLSQASRLS